MNDRATRSTILGMLMLRSWRSYDLVKEMRRNLHYFWPRAESRIYAILKKLEESDEARAEAVHTGARSASVWSSTSEGRAAFEAWLGESPAATVLDCEALVRVFLAPSSDHPAVAAAIHAVREEADDLAAMAARIAHEYDLGTAPFQDRVASRALVFDFLASWADMRVQWAGRADALLAAYASADAATRDELALAHLRARRDALGWGRESHDALS